MQQGSILHGDALEQLRTLPDESVQCVVTSPPYFGLRDYGTAEWDGGDPDCAHKGAKQIGSGGMLSIQPHNAGSFTGTVGDCACGATRVDSQIGLESSPADYIAKLVAVFREVRRVLRKDGVAWVNMGDSYARNGGEQGGGNRQLLHMEGTQARMLSIPEGSGLKPKDLMGMPWRLAFALQADGWYLRQDIIWAKPNPMPESVTDRCTKAHEYVFLLSKSERYFYDAVAIAEESNTFGRQNTNGLSPKSVLKQEAGHFSDKTGLIDPYAYETRNKRSVWTITTEPYPEAHFATFPTELPRICILAGSRVGDTILDPFNGSGTTGQVAIELARQYVGIELNPEYVALTNKRLSRTTLGLPLEIAA